MVLGFLQRTSSPAQPVIPASCGILIRHGLAYTVVLLPSAFHHACNTYSSPRNPAAIQPGPQKAPSDPKNDTDQRSFRSQVRTQLLTANHPSNTDAVGTRVGAAAPGAPRASLDGGANDGEFFIPAQDCRGVRKRALRRAIRRAQRSLPCTEVKFCMQTYRSLYLRRLLLLLPLSSCQGVFMELRRAFSRALR